MPLIQGSTTPKANAVATAASTACPPALSTRAPITDAVRFWLTTMPPREQALNLRTCRRRDRLGERALSAWPTGVARICARLAFGLANLRPIASLSEPRGTARHPCAKRELHHTGSVAVATSRSPSYGAFSTSSRGTADPCPWHPIGSPRYRCQHCVSQHH